jgi:hypothetical protein
MISIRKLVAVDMVWLGKWIILSEYAFGIILPLILGILSVRSGGLGFEHLGWSTILGYWLIGIAANYVPMFIFAVLIARGGTVKEEGQPELARARRYGVQQIVILIPLFVVIISLVQENRKRKSK